jgi:hypothetical protein
MASGEHYRPYSGSCPRCRAALGLASVRADGVWYCNSACAGGASETNRRPRAVTESRLTNRPRRFHRKRAPKELKSATSERRSIL